MRRDVVQPESVVLDGERVEFDLVRMVRRRHAHLVVNAQGRLQLRVPYRCTLEWARRILQDNATWVRERLASARLERPAVIQDGCLLRFDGRLLRLRVICNAQRSLFDESWPHISAALEARPDPARAGRERSMALDSKVAIRFELAADTLTAHMLALGGDDHLPMALERWYRAEAKRRLPPRLQRFARLLGREPGTITIRGQSTRWGSCSSRGTISLNWKLLLIDSALADYVLAHEACHLVELNHSARFWRLVAQLMPDYAARRDALARVPATLSPPAQTHPQACPRARSRGASSTAGD
ncbi:MAG: M48 family metallopeptidase [Gammaproteobacteria bacterium]|nr:M48 family metallopeptidase [Gammaproteobacteria bacterium]